MSIVGTPGLERPAKPVNALAVWHKALPVAEQKKLNTNLLTKAPRDLRKNFRAALKNVGHLELDTLVFLRGQYGITVSSDGVFMGPVTARRPLTIAA